jgi:uncharacterized HAD superfamily protein
MMTEPSIQRPPEAAGPDLLAGRRDLAFVAAPGSAPLLGPAPGPLRIAVDFDGVLFDHVPAVLRGFRDAHGIDLQDEGFRYWDFFQYRAVRERNLTWNCVRSVLRAIDTDLALHELPPRDPHAAEVMDRWRAAGHRVLVVTAREAEARAATERFLQAHAIPHDGLVLGAARKTGYDVLVDDAPHNVLMAAADGGLALLMDHSYNRDVPTRGNPVRVGDWKDVARVVAEKLASSADLRPETRPQEFPPLPAPLAAR